MSMWVLQVEYMAHTSLHSLCLSGNRYLVNLIKSGTIHLHIIKIMFLTEIYNFTPMLINNMTTPTFSVHFSGCGGWKIINKNDYTLCHCRLKKNLLSLAFDSTTHVYPCVHTSMPHTSVHSLCLPGNR